MHALLIISMSSFLFLQHWCQHNIETTTALSTSVKLSLMPASARPAIVLGWKTSCMGYLIITHIVHQLPVLYRQRHLPRAFNHFINPSCCSSLTLSSMAHQASSLLIRTSHWTSVNRPEVKNRLFQCLSTSLLSELLRASTAMRYLASILKI